MMPPKLSFDVDYWLPDPRLDPANTKLVESFRAQKYDPEAYTLYTYAAIQAWAPNESGVSTDDR